MMDRQQISQVVHIVDDDEAVRDALSMLMESVGIACKTYADALVFLASEFDFLSGCVILDIRMPRMGGLECQEKLAARGCHLPIIFITGHGDVPMAVEAMKRGAVDFIQKPFRDQELLDRVQRVLQANADARNAMAESAAAHARFRLLTPRERDILQRIVSGDANKAIAIDLSISERTVEIHRAKVMAKMQANSLAELVRMAITIESTAASAVAADF